MLGMFGLSLIYDYDTALLKVKDFWANEGSPFTDVWHVDLMGWNYPGMVFKSRFIQRWNNSKTSVGAVIATRSWGHYIEVHKEHIDPIWSTIVNYHLTGEIPEQLLK